MKIIHTDTDSFEDIFGKIKDRGAFQAKHWKKAAAICENVCKRKDSALFEYTQAFDNWMPNARTVEVSSHEIEAALSSVNAKDIKILKQAARRIEKYHRRQVIRDWFVSDEEGVKLGQRIVPLELVGVYAPGGLACYPSTVIMAAVPAKIAGVRNIILVSPAKNGNINPLIIAAAKLSGITRIFKIGGAQAIAALAYGTETIPRVDKIVGPGNAYVAAAKKMVYGQVSIDMIAGPSEVLVVADATASASVVAADLLAQAEHDEMASAILVTPDESLARQVFIEVKAQLKNLQRKSIAKGSLNKYGAVIVTKNMDEAVELTNRIAPEHLELMVKNPWKMLPQIKHAGAIFLGHNTPEALGDYIAGPNHILPTGGTARFSSPLGVYDFVKRSSVLFFSRKSLEKYGKQAVRFTEMEKLDAHGKSITIRLQLKKS
jgi:histidinol dehydrogenase